MPYTSRRIELTEHGLVRVHEPLAFTFPEPELKEHDVMIALDRDQIYSEHTYIDEQLARRIDRDANFDALTNTNVQRILKISNQANSIPHYENETDFAITTQDGSEGILWKTTRRPGDLESYYVTYQTSEEFYRRFEISAIRRPMFRNIVRNQQLDVTEGMPGDAIYQWELESGWDDTRKLYGFPQDAWVSRGVKNS